MKKKKHQLLVFAFALLFLFSTALVAYPLISNYATERHQSAILTDYEEQLEQAESGEITAAWAAAQAYNATLSGGRLDSNAAAEYDVLLNLTGSGIMGYLDIPRIDVHLPVYHGTQSLDMGAIHLRGTSLPIGGSSTHTVISAHSGMAAAKMFTDLEELVTGDRFSLCVLNETLTYKVDQIVTVTPDDASQIAVIPGEDYCTLLTCTPYGVNTHRLLVRGHRILESATSEEQAANTPAKSFSLWVRQYLHGILSGVIAVSASAAGILIIHFIYRSRKRK